jgi:hypothetical protein
MRLDDVAGRYWEEVGQHHAGADNTWRQIGFVVDFLGKDALLTEITGDDVARLVAWRRGHKRRDGSPLSPYTINDTVEQLKKLFTRAKAWGARFGHEPVWRDHWLDEPQERVRRFGRTKEIASTRPCGRTMSPSLPSPEPLACGWRNAYCGGRRSIEAPTGSPNPARAASW